MTIKSLEDLNTYALNPITYTDNRSARVVFDRGATVDQYLTINENATFDFPWGINIDDITQYDVALMEYTIDLSNWTSPITLTWASFPAHCTVNRTGNVWVISGIQNSSDWDRIKRARVQSLFGFSGLIAHSGSLSWFADAVATTRTVAQWDVFLTVTAIEYFGTAPDLTYVSNEVKNNISTTSIIVDPGDFDPVWTLRIYALDDTTIDEIFSDGSPAEAAWNDTLKEFVITGDSESINAVLSTLDIDFARSDADIILWFSLANNYTSSIENKIQWFYSRDFIADPSVVSAISGTLYVVWGGTAIPQVNTFFASEANPIYAFIADPFESNTSISTLPNFTWRPTLELQTEATMVPNGGYLLEMPATTLSSNFSTYCNAGFLIEPDPAEHTAVATVQSWPIKYKDALVLTIDQTLMPNWDAQPGSNYVLNRFTFQVGSGSLNSSGVNYTHQFYGPGGFSTSALSDSTANIPELVFVLEPVSSGFTAQSFRIEDGHEQLQSLDKWGKHTSYDIDLYLAVDIQSISREGPLYYGTDATGMFYNTRESISPADTSSVALTNWTSIEQDIANMNISNITIMDEMFLASDFDYDISTWSVGQVTSMERMFSNSRFNQDINVWDVSSVTNMSGMFLTNPFFNQNLNSWDTSSVTNMGGMFFDATAFDGNISSWDVSNVSNWAWNNPNTNTDVDGYDDAAYYQGQYGMFGSAEDGYYEYINNLTTSGSYRYNHYYRFGTYPAVADRVTKFNGNITGWNMISSNDMIGMFYGNKAFNQNISGWNTSNIKYFQYAFYGTGAFDQDISGWNVSNAVVSSNFDTNSNTNWTSGEKPTF